MLWTVDGRWQVEGRGKVERSEGGGQRRLWAEQVGGKHDAEVRSKVEALDLTHTLNMWTGVR